ncbi:hypothetical protein LTR37_016769 [Vermiconidia calcicola]|uniref:Uncharacterized protein n=1 Tax=Vermiconidia calcicola TaxID=1690605 RepID=A0ACC3MNH2_9PEZI|nr:hypothetical protein LTR37_016769 [Vermiconidia calcicola]
MFSKTLLATTAALLTLTHAQKAPAAIVTIEASHGGAGGYITYDNVTVPLTATYTNESVLDTVSTLHLVDSINSPLNSITCTPFRYANGTGDAGLAFTSGKPSFLSTNTVQVGSIYGYLASTAGRAARFWAEFFAFAHEDEDEAAYYEDKDRWSRNDCYIDARSNYGRRKRRSER